MKCSPQATVPIVREGMALSDFTRAVVEQAPPPPSSAIAGNAAIANEMGCSARALADQLRGELDAIVSMAIRKEPERRYASVEALAADVSAYLTGFPVAARPDSLAYRARKLVGRHRALAAMSCLTLVSLSGGLAVSLSLERKEAAARIVAQDSLHRMQLESAALGQALNELVQKEVPTLPQLTHAEEARAQVDRSPSDSAAKASLAAALQQLFDADAKAGDFQSAANHCKQAEQLSGGGSLRERCDYYDGKAQLEAPSGGLGAFDTGLTAQKPFDALAAARNYLALGKLLATGGGSSEARDAFNRAAALFGVALEQQPDSAEAKRGVAEARAQRDSIPRK